MWQTIKKTINMGNLLDKFCLIQLFIRKRNSKWKGETVFVKKNLDWNIHILNTKIKQNWEYFQFSRICSYQVCKNFESILQIKI